MIQTVTIEGRKYGAAAFSEGATTPNFVSKSDFHNDLYLFLCDWFSQSPLLDVFTSGSTGEPKRMSIEKKRMMQSAQLTCSFLHLKANDTALLCMSLNYIAGKMMVVRALVAGLNLYLATPSGNPLKDIDTPITLAAMIPLQVYNSLQNESEKERLKSIDKLIIGGGAIDPQLEKNLKNFPNKVFSTYGMTETLSHIALRQLNGANQNEHYIPFASVKLSLSEDDALIIDAPLVSKERLYTNDIADLFDDGSFMIVGRKDNIINSGGVKIQIEKLEHLLSSFIDTPFAISSLPDEKFGEIVVLVVVGDEIIDMQQIEQNIPAYDIPKKTIRIDSIPTTETGKINRPLLKKYISHI